MDEEKKIDAATHEELIQKLKEPVEEQQSDSFFVVFFEEQVDVFGAGGLEDSRSGSPCHADKEHQHASAEMLHLESWI